MKRKIITIAREYGSGGRLIGRRLAQELPAAEQVFLAQSQEIRKIAEKESCVVVGRCADYILHEFDNCLRVFIHAPLEWRIKCVQEKYHETVANYRDYLQKQDKNRAGYYNYFTQNKWGKAQNYHISLNSSIGVPAAVGVLQEMVIAFFEDVR